ncbi:Hexose transporter HXT13 [Lachnellula suecica]|uniref:Hexose transporter HXT13 n=1 Tax=Lachnellula suecica TaxID=602035 RepID=A0A8T9CDQ9_9HELO|nr:Hexose transporter HXT13 [Lachnellula suecica]
MFNNNIRKHFNKQLGLVCLLIAISTFNYGFDNQAFATTQAMDSFTHQFGVYNTKTKKYALDTYWLSLFNSLNYIGFGAGVIIGSFVSARFGRRWCMFSMSCFALVTATIAVTSSRREQILAARVLNYIYVGMELAVVPVFQSEIVPTPVRGFIVGTYQFSLILGGIVINSICRGTSGLSDNRAWRIPLGCFYIVPTIVLSLIWLIQESPRWLLSKGRTEEARTALAQLRHGTISPDEMEHELLATQITLEKESERGHLKELWQGVNFKRTMIVIFVNFFQQATGQAFASQYGAIFIKSLGTVNPFNMTLINGGINSLAIVFSLLSVDKIGRKTLLLAGAIIQLIGLLAMGGVGTIGHPTISDKTAIVALLSVFSFGFSLGWAPLTYVVTTELPALHLRDQSQRVASLVNVVTAFTVSFTLPYLLNAPYANLGSKVGFIYGSMALCTLIFTFFFVPECKGKSLEEIDLMFHERVPLRKFQSYQAEEKLETVIQKEKGITERVEEV